MTCPGVERSPRLRWLYSSVTPGFPRQRPRARAMHRQRLTAPSFDLTPEKVSHLKAAVAAHDYVAAEELLLKEIEPDPHSPRAARLLAYLGSVYFLNHDYLNAAIAWKKSDAIAPLGPDLQFSAGDGVHPDFASGLGAAGARITFCSRHQKRTVPLLARAGSITTPNIIRRRPTASSRPSYWIQPWRVLTTTLASATSIKTRMTLAVKNFNRAIELDRNALHPSPWPYLNLAVALAVSGPDAGGGNRFTGSSPARSSACGGTLPPGQRA